MATPIGALHASLSAGHAQFASDMGKAKAAVRTNASGMSRAMDKVKGSFTGTIKSITGMRGALAVTAGATGFAYFIKRSIDAADELSKMAQSVGVSTETLSTLQFAAKRANVEISSLKTGLVRFSRNMADATKGIGEAREGFMALGIAVRNEDGTMKSSEEAIGEIADKFKEMEDGAAKTALATQLFGRAGADLIPLLNAGSDGIQALQERARELGLELSTEAGRSAEEFNDRLTDLKESASGLGRGIATDLLPKMNDIVEIMMFAKKEGGLLSAVWAGMGGIGAAIFTDEMDSTAEKLATARKKLEELQARKPLFQSRGFKKQISDQQAIVSGLESQLEVEKSLAEAAAGRAAEEERSKAAATEKIEAAIAGAREEESAEKAAQTQADARQKRGEAAILQAQKQLELKTDATELERVTWEVEKGRYAELLPAQQQELLNLAAKKDEMAAIAEQVEISRTEIDELSDLEDQAFRQFEQNTGKSGEQMGDLGGKIESWGQQSGAAMLDFALSGKASFKDMIDSMISDLVRLIAKQMILKALGGGILGGIFAEGAAFSGGRVIPFARGGVVSSPTIFPMAQGMGLMGEAGPEAVLPLKRTADGDLGVQTTGKPTGGSKALTISIPSGDLDYSKAAVEKIVKGVVVDVIKNQGAQFGPYRVSAVRT